MNKADYQKHVEEDARLIILRELNDQPNGTWNESLLNIALEGFGHRKSREWLRTQLRKLEELGAVSITEMGSVYVAMIKRPGVDHVERRAFLVGVKRPSFGE